MLESRSILRLKSRTDILRFLNVASSPRHALSWRHENQHDERDSSSTLCLDFFFHTVLGPLLPHCAWTSSSTLCLDFFFHTVLGLLLPHCAWTSSSTLCLDFFFHTVLGLLLPHCAWTPSSTLCLDSAADIVLIAS